MSYVLQYYTSSGLPARKLDPNVCAVCGNQILVHDNDEAIMEKTYKLSCDHMYPCFTPVRNGPQNSNILTALANFYL